MSAAAPLRVVVTGAGSGIGRAIATALVRRGDAVVGLDRDRAALASVADGIGNGFAPLAGDLADPSTPGALVGRAREIAGPLDGLVNAAGIYPVTPLLELEVAEWDAVHGVNLRAPFLATQAFARSLLADGRPGRVVNVGSPPSMLVRPGTAHYGASKAGLDQLTRDMALELAPHGIRVNAVAPGLTAAERVMAHAAGQGAVARAAELARSPLGRDEARPEELTELVIHLLSDASSNVTGGVFLVDGGAALGVPGYRPVPPPRPLSRQ